MTTAELINKLQEVDPEGTKKVAYLAGLSEEPRVISDAFPESNGEVAFIALA